MKTAILLLSVTAYVPANDIGSMMQPVLPGLTCGVSRDMKHLRGTWINVEGHGVRYVNDLCAKHIKNTIDLAVVDRQEAREVGRTLRTVRVGE